MAGAVSLFSWVLMFCLAERWPLRIGLPVAAVLGAGICLLGWWSVPAMAASAGIAIVLGIVVPMTFSSTPFPGGWDQSMFHTQPRMAWYVSVWFWWALLPRRWASSTGISGNIADGDDCTWLANTTEESGPIDLDQDLLKSP